MSKKLATIFDYDSSDDEQNEDLDISVISANNSNLFYSMGNQIAHSKGILAQYRTKKLENYTKHPSLHLINKFLTQQFYTPQDQIDKYLEPLLKGSSKPMPGIAIKIQIVSKGRELYQKLEKLALDQQSDAVIETVQGECFTVLNKYLKKRVEEPDKEDVQAIGRAFGITTKTKTAHINKTKKFIKNVQKIDEIQETTAKLIDLLTESSELLKDAINNIIIGEHNPTDNTILIVFSIDAICQDKTYVIVRTNKLYQEIEKLVTAQQPEAVIDTVHWQCFIELDKYLKKQTQEPDAQDIQAIGQVFDIITQSKTVDIAKTKELIKTIQNIDGIQETISGLLTLTQQSSKLLNAKIQTHVFTQTITVNIDLAIHILCDEQLASLSNQLAEFDQDVNSKIAKLEFFNTSTGNKSSAQDFLTSSLLYQKYLKTITKFVLLRHHGQKLSHVIKITDKTTIQATSKFSVGLKRTEEVLSLGAYSDVSDKLLAVKSLLAIDEAGLVAAIQAILKGKDLYSEYSDHIDSVKILYDITYLLFSCETNRNPGALISNILFLELVKAGKYKTSQMADHLPMAMSGAIEIGRFYHGCYKTKKANDYANTCKAPSNLDEFIIKEAVLFWQFIGGTLIVIGERGLQLIAQQNELSILIKKQKKAKSNKDKIQQHEKELIKITKEIKEIAAQCIAELKKIKKGDIDKLKDLIQVWYGIEIKIAPTSDDKKEDEKQHVSDSLKTNDTKTDDSDDEESESDSAPSAPSKSDKSGTQQQTGKSNFYNIIQNDGGGDCAVYAVRDALQTISHHNGEIQNDKIQDLRKEICNVTKKFLPLYKLARTLEKQPGEKDFSGQEQRQNSQKWEEVIKFYKDIFGNENFGIFKSVLLQEIKNKLASKGNNKSTIENLQCLQVLLTSIDNWDKLSADLVKHIFIRFVTLEINVEAILQDHKLKDNPDAYYEKAAQVGTWLNNSEIGAYLMSLGFIFESGIPAEKGTCITYRNTEGKVLYFYNNGQDSNSGSSVSRGTHWMAAKLKKDAVLPNMDTWEKGSSESEDISMIFQMASKLSSSNMQKLKDLLGMSEPLKGYNESGEEQNIDYIHPFFGKYTLSASRYILELRLKNLHLSNIQVLEGIFLDNANNNITTLVETIIQSNVKTTLVPLNLYNKHAVGLIFEKSKSGVLLVKYFDSQNRPIPQELEELVVGNQNVNILFREVAVARQKYANCSPEVIENFILILTGHRLTQKEAIELHSKLVEDELLSSSNQPPHFVEYDTNFATLQILSELGKATNSETAVDNVVTELGLHLWYPELTIL